MSAPDPIAAVLGTTIAERGADYCRRGKVVSMQQQADGAWLAQVSGSQAAQVYRVQLRFFDNGALKQALCDCPYDGLCKHIAAVWYALSADQLPAPNVAEKPPRKLRVLQPPANTAAAQDLLDTATALFRRYARGCDYHESGRLGNEVWALLEQAAGLDTADRFAVYHKVYQRLNSIIQRSDDSGGYLGDLIFYCIETSGRLHRQGDAKLRVKIEKFWRKMMDDRETHWIAVEEASLLWQEALCAFGRADEVLIWLEQEWANLKRDNGYQREDLAVRKYQVLAVIDEARAQVWMQTMLRYPKMRRIAVDQLMAQQQWQAAEKLLKQALQQNPNQETRQWSALLLEIAEQTGQQQAACDYAKALAFGDNQIDEAYYRRWKTLLPEQEWPQAWARQEQKLQQQPVSEDALAQLYTLENCSEKLCRLLQQTQKEYLLEQYIGRLNETQQSAAALNWLDLTMAATVSLKERKHYAKWVKKLNHLYDRFPAVREPMGVRMAEVRQTYAANRPAMLQEMLRLKAAG
ncbi:SWIM zinc finger family protein [Uruburuella testudinis]|uniref:SWIM zinc finger family protein n=1 Tax=Uruburuella testudinis TaxID=1282863 RepID=A0ABY4DT82_9NEIS|nr:SWIM zinc finger family protein [Uruburuella testudinis]UOO81900.1 SWIM zinc finger family protein [Uruburuella testudinis]